MYSTSFCGPIEIRAKTPSSAHSPREPESIPIVASINDNILSITIGNNVGVAHIRIGKEDGTTIVHENIFSTPHMISIFINETGFHTITITLNNGDCYYGEFTVE